MIFSGSLSGRDFVLFDSLDGNDAYSQMFYVIFQFCAQVKFAALDGNPASIFTGLFCAICTHVVVLHSPVVF